MTVCCAVLLCVRAQRTAATSRREPRGKWTDNVAQSGDVVSTTTRHPIRAGHQRPIPHSQANRVTHKIASMMQTHPNIPAYVHSLVHILVVLYDHDATLHTEFFLR